MKSDILDLIIEAYNNDMISADDAVVYTEFVECANLKDESDVNNLMEISNALGRELYLTEKAFFKKPVKKESKFKARVANVTAKLNKHKKKIATGAAIVGTGVLGYTAAKLGDGKKVNDLKSALDFEKDNNQVLRSTIQQRNNEYESLNKKYDAVKGAFKQANAKKRDAQNTGPSLEKDKRRLERKIKELQGKLSRKAFDAMQRDKEIKALKNELNHLKNPSSNDTTFTDSSNGNSVDLEDLAKKMMGNGVK